MRRPRTRTRAGFTVLEALIALVIIGLAVVTTVEALGGGLRAGGQVSRHLEVVALTESRMSELGALPRDSLTSYSSGRDGVFTPPYERYRWHAAVERVSGTRSLLHAAVTVSWVGGSYALETILYRPDEVVQTPPGSR